MIALWLALALAQEPPTVPVTPEAPDAAPSASEEPPVITVFGQTGPPREIIVYGKVLVEAARNRLIETAAAEGYTKKIRRDGYLVLRDPNSVVAGEIHLYDDGRVDVTRQPVQFGPPGAHDAPISWLTCLILPLCFKPGGQLYSARKFHHVVQDTLAAIEPDSMAYNDRIADWASDRKADRTAAVLEDLWFEGKPVDDGPTIDGWEARRAAILDYWDTRNDNEWGDKIRERVESFIRGEVQQGEHPYTTDELDAFSRAQRSTRAFPDVTRPRDIADLP